MFCCKCGTQNPDAASYCNECGSLLYKQETKHPDKSAKEKLPRQVEIPQNAEQRRLAEELLAIDQRPHECHACGCSDRLHGWDFGLGKKTSTKWAWGETALSVAVSAVSIPLIGVAGLQLPGKKTRYQVLRLRLILCDSYWEGQAKYSLHPWWQTATRLGYTEFFDANALKHLEPAR